VFGVKSVDCPMSLLDEEVLGVERSIYAAGVAVRVAWIRRELRRTRQKLAAWVETLLKQGAGLEGIGKTRWVVVFREERVQSSSKLKLSTRRGVTCGGMDRR
jgi:hypothetical protein